MAASKQKDWISLLNVTACFAVVLMHTNSVFFSFSDTQRYWKTANVIVSTAYFAVPCFYMISGATLISFRDRYTLRQYLSKRIMKTVIPFIAWSIIGILWSILFRTITPPTEPLQLIKFFYNSTMDASVVSYYWFFPAIFSVYLCIPLFGAVPKEQRKEVFSYLVAAGFVINLIVPFIKKVLFPSLSWKISMPVATVPLLYAILGYLISEYPLSRKQRLAIYGCAVAGLVCNIVGNYFYSMAAGKTDRTLLGATLSAVVYSVGIFTWFRYYGNSLMEHSIIAGLVGFLKQYTFGIYLTHWYVIRLIQRLPFVNVQSIVYRLGAPFVVIPLCVLLIWLLRKIPVVQKIVPQ